MSQLEYNCAEVINSVTCIKVAYLGCYLEEKKVDYLGSLEVVCEVCLSVPQFLFAIDE